MKKREKENGVELSTNCRRLKMPAKDGKMHETDVARRGGNIAGNVRKELESDTGKSVISKKNSKNPELLDECAIHFFQLPSKH